MGWTRPECSSPTLNDGEKGLARPKIWGRNVSCERPSLPPLDTDSLSDSSGTGSGQREQAGASVILGLWRRGAGPMLNGHFFGRPGMTFGVAFPEFRPSSSCSRLAHISNSPPPPRPHTFLTQQPQATTATTTATATTNDGDSDNKPEPHIHNPRVSPLDTIETARTLPPLKRPSRAPPSLPTPRAPLIAKRRTAPPLPEREYPRPS